MYPSITKQKIQFSSVAQSCPTLCDPKDRSTPGLPVHHQPQSLLKFISIESMMLSNHLILCRPLLLLPSIFPNISVLSNELALHIRWPKYWSLSFSISPSNEYSGLISFRMDCLDLLAVQGTLKSLLQQHRRRLNIYLLSQPFELYFSKFSVAQLSFTYMIQFKNNFVTISGLIFTHVCLLVALKKTDIESEQVLVRDLDPDCTLEPPVCLFKNTDVCSPIPQ